MVGPAFLVSVDTEGDNVWAKPKVTSTRNALFCPRFQALCDSVGWRPTWLVNWEMAHDEAFVDFARDVIARGAGEVGMHLHAWNTPPRVDLTVDDAFWQPYLVDYPEGVLREKIYRMTRLLEERFERPIVTHRAGRWALDGRYARALADAGYLVDTSVTPHVSWAKARGAPWSTGGTDYTFASEAPHFVDLTSPFERGYRPRTQGVPTSGLLEIPMTVASRHERLPWLPRAMASALPPLWLRPRGGNLGDMLFLIERAVRQRRPYVQLMLHSSELMPGGSPTFPDTRSIERMYESLAAVFSAARGRFRGLTFAEYRTEFVAAGG